MHVSAYVCTYESMYVRMCTYECMYGWIDTCMYTAVYLHICILNVCIDVCTYVVYMYLYIRTYVWMYVLCTCERTCVCMYIYVLFVCRGSLYIHRLYTHRHKRNRGLNLIWPHKFSFKPLLGLEPQFPASHANHSATETSLKRMFRKPMIYVVARNHAVHP